WLERGLPRPLAVAVPAAAVGVLLVGLLPLHRLLADPTLLGNALGLVPVARLSGPLGGGGDVRALVIFAALDIALAMLLLPRRLAAPVLLAAVAGVLATSTATAFTSVRSR